MVSGRIEDRDLAQLGDAEEFLILFLEFFAMNLVAVDDVARPQEESGLEPLSVFENLAWRARLREPGGRGPIVSRRDKPEVRDIRLILELPGVWNRRQQWESITCLGVRGAAEEDGGENFSH